MNEPQSPPRKKRRRRRSRGGNNAAAPGGQPGQPAPAGAQPGQAGPQQQQQQHQHQQRPQQQHGGGNQGRQQGNNNQNRRGGRHRNQQKHRPHALQQGQQGPVFQQQPPRKLGRLTEALGPEVDPDVRRRGDGYFRQGRIHDSKATPERMSAEVRGKGGNYPVTIDMAHDVENKRSTISGICACPYFAGGRGPCKHIWAVLCYADGTAACAFQPPVDHQVGFHSVRLAAKRRSSIAATASAEPDAKGRIRGISVGTQVVALVDGKSLKRVNQSPAKGHVNWREALKLVGHAQRDIGEIVERAGVVPGTDVHYVLDSEATLKTGQLTVQIFRLMMPRKPVGDAVESGTPGVPQLVAAPADPQVLGAMVSGPDREILARIFGSVASSIVRAGQWDDDTVPLRIRGNSFAVSDALRPALLQMMAATGRLGWLDADEAKLEAGGPYEHEMFRPLTWDEADPWAFGLSVVSGKQGQSWILRGEFRRDRARLSLGETLASFADGQLVTRTHVARYGAGDASAFGWISAMREMGSIEVMKADQAAFLRQFSSIPSAPVIDLPEGAGWKIVAGEPKPKLVFLTMPTPEVPILTANYEFVYEAPAAAPPPPAPVPVAAPAAEAPAPGKRRRRGAAGATTEADDATVAAAEPAPAPQPPPAPAPTPANEPRLVVQRNRHREEAQIRELCAHPGVQPSAGRATAGADVFVDPGALSDLVADLSDRGWAVEAEGQRLRVGRSFQVDVKSSTGMDWLDLRALFDFGDGGAVQLPRILEAVKSGSDRVVLADGSVGLLPEGWRQKLEPILRMGEGVEGGGLRYRGSQAAFLDVLVSEAAEANLDEPFRAFREKLASFSGVTEAEPAKSFVGELRPYQRQGLGWLEFLDEFALGGCLADDMGLGKTIQVLAHLQKRRGGTKKAKRSPALIVAPTSLIYNWVDEATRFVPDLKVYAHVGGSRHREASDFGKYDLVVTSYGTMRSDVEMLASTVFDYVVLDEAQAIKNETTQVTQAARMLRANRRLAMSGTPVENRLSELGSLFKFLNPGILEGSQDFADLFSGSGRLSSGQLESLARLVRPFLLRRTKEQVLPDLPGKTESTVFCVLGDEQRREYDELAAFYRDSLQKKIKTEGIGKSRMHVLEALLRLRQLACHPGLISAERADESSAKMELLEEQLDEVMASGRKALVFSQFTSMLAIVRARLDAKGISYEYLDGATTDRKERVEHFQTDKSVRVFLISLKAGGVGLNLTAADYCFILDPWWNPASEAQAIDRAHRIGQQNHVFAYRLIARGTVEEKILALQESKRKLVEGIIADDGGVVADITAKDLEFLLA